jgi:hypothetical protein
MPLRNPFKRAKTGRAAQPIRWIGYGAPYRQVYTKRAQPDPGALGISFDTYAVPKYSPLGNGPGNRRDFATVNPVMQPLQGQLLYVIGAPGVMTGGMYSQPLVNTTTPAMPGQLQAAFAGITLEPGSYLIPG